MDKFSVLIRNKNEERYIGYQIQSLIDYIGEEFELIIIDNESTDDSLKIVKTFDFLNIKQINISKNDYTQLGSLNRGVRNSTNPYILILSAL